MWSNKAVGSNKKLLFEPKQAFMLSVNATSFEPIRLVLVPEPAFA